MADVANDTFQWLVLRLLVCHDCEECSGECAGAGVQTTGSKGQNVRNLPSLCQSATRMQDTLAKEETACKDNRVLRSQE